MVSRSQHRQRSTTPYQRSVETILRFSYNLKLSRVSTLGLILVTSIAIIAIFAPYLAPYPQDAGKIVRLSMALRAPSTDHLFGTDEVGRDILSRVLLGARVSLSVSLTALVLIAMIGIPLGLIAGYVDQVRSVIMRITDVFLAVPPLVLALVVAAALSSSLQNLVVAMAVSWWPWYTRLVYGEVLSAKHELYVEASRQIGASSWHIIFKEILPNVLSPIIIRMTLDLGYLIITAANLSFLGLGVTSPTPEWGLMIAEGRLYLPTAWWLCVFPGLFILIAVLGFNLLGDGLRDILTGDVQ